nr:MAG TPA: hypothetical protein [Caudoviricetes sp.]DAV97488.1 MAG TPA: hypothetical protein [Caudoviricetes sp.]
MHHAYRLFLLINNLITLKITDLYVSFIVVC